MILRNKILVHREKKKHAEKSSIEAYVKVLDIKITFMECNDTFKMPMLHCWKTQYATQNTLFILIFQYLNNRWQAHLSTT